MADPRESPLPPELKVCPRCLAPRVPAGEVTQWTGFYECGMVGGLAYGQSRACAWAESLLDQRAKADTAIGLARLYMQRGEFDKAGSALDRYADDEREARHVS